MKKLLILSRGSIWAEKLQMHAEKAGFSVCVLNESESCRASWHVVLAPVRCVQIKIAGQTHFFYSNDLFYDDLSWSLSGSVKYLYKDGSSYHQHAWQAFFIGLYKVLSPIITHQPKHWSSYFWLWHAMIKTAKDVGLKTIDLHPCFSTLHINKTWIDKRFWVLNLSHHGVVMRVVKTGNHWSIYELKGCWCNSRLPRSLRDRLNKMAQCLSLHACEWVILHDEDWYICGCYRWGAEAINDSDTNKILVKLLGQVRYVQLRSTIPKSDRPDLQIAWGHQG